MRFHFSASEAEKWNRGISIPGDVESLRASESAGVDQVPSSRPKRPQKNYFLVHSLRSRDVPPIGSLRRSQSWRKPPRLKARRAGAGVYCKL
jgi:hypothetical protein